MSQNRWDPFEDYEDDLSDYDERSKGATTKSQISRPLLGGGDEKTDSGREQKPLIPKYKGPKRAKFKRPTLRQLFAAKSAPSWWILWLFSVFTAATVEAIVVVTYYYVRDFRLLWLVGAAGVVPLCGGLLLVLFFLRKIKVLPYALVIFGAVMFGYGGGLLGGYYYDRYWTYTFGTVVSNVDSTQPPRAYNDTPNYFDFINNTYVKSSLVGYTEDPDTHTRYCVAPLLVKKAGAAPTEVYFWAVAENCCQGSGVHSLATCTNWEDRKHVIGHALSSVKRSYATEAALTAQEWHNFRGNLHAEYVEVFPSLPTDEKDYYYRAAWARLAIAPIVSPLGLILWGLLYSLLLCCFPIYIDDAAKVRRVSGSKRKQATREAAEDEI